MPLHTLSVIIPAHQRRRELEQAIASLLNQTIPPQEIIVVDDGSNPPLSVSSAVKLIRLNVNKGGAVARNVGIDAANSDFIALLDSDDWWEPERIERLQPILDQATSATEKILIFDNLRFARRKSRNYPPVIPSDQSLGDPMVFGNIVIQTSSLVYHRRWREVLRFDEGLRKHQDWDFILEAQRHGFTLRNSASGTVVLRPGFFRMRVQNSSSASSSVRFLEKHRGVMSEKAARRFHAENISPHQYTGVRRLLAVAAHLTRRDIGVRTAIGLARGAFRGLGPAAPRSI